MFRTALLAIFSAALLALTAAPASANFVCDFLPMPDGFVALRAEPSAQAPLIARIEPGHIVLLLLGSPASGEWRQVTHWPDGRVPEETEPRFREGRRGWVERRLFEDCG